MPEDAASTFPPVPAKKGGEANEESQALYQQARAKASEVSVWDGSKVFWKFFVAPPPTLSL